MDCTTLPSQLVESELFGHERGAFTGADRRVPGRVELAHGGTLFLDEIGDLPPEMQGKLLRFLQDRTFERVGGRQELSSDVRILCATHRDLERYVADGKFREDLYYRVRVIEIEIPPLRARGPDEIEQLATYFVSLQARRHGREAPSIEPAAMAALRAHRWPGNVRELEHQMESAVVLCTDGRITPELLPTRRLVRDSTPPAQQGVHLPVGMTLDDATRRYVEAVLEACEGNKTRAARMLRIGRNTLARALDGEREGRER